MPTEINKTLDENSNLIKNAINLSTTFIQFNKDLLPHVFTKEMLEVCLDNEKKTLKKIYAEYKDLIKEQQSDGLSIIEKINMIGEISAYLDDLNYIYKLCKIYEEAINEDSLQDDEVVVRIEQLLRETWRIQIQDESQDLENINNLKR